LFESSSKVLIVLVLLLLLLLLLLLALGIRHQISIPSDQRVIYSPEKSEKKKNEQKCVVIFSGHSAGLSIPLRKYISLHILPKCY